MLFASNSGVPCSACFALRCAVTVLLTFAQIVIGADLAQSSVRAIWFHLLTSAKRDSRDLCRYFIGRGLGQEGDKCRGKA
jgi:hypothetical protein